MSHSELFKMIRAKLQPERPIRTIEFLRGRDKEFKTTIRELRDFDGIPFIFGYRGVGKTSLARTAAQLATSSDREHVYVACAPGSRMLEIFREVGEGLLSLAIRFGAKKTIETHHEIEVSLNPSLKTSITNSVPSLPDFKDANEAVRVLKNLDDILPDARQTVVVIDELEELSEEDRNALAFLIKQIGDQEFSTRFVLVGIAENVDDLIGTHASVPRYITEISLKPLIAQDLIDIVVDAAQALDIEVGQEFLYRVAIIGNGFPYYSHLIGKTILVEAVENDAKSITEEIYNEGISVAISQSLQELRSAYDAAVQRGQDYFKHMIWALADFDVVDVRIDDWKSRYRELAQKYSWSVPGSNKLNNAQNNMRKESHGEIIRITPAKYGSTETRYRFRRFTNPLMKGYVRLQAEHEGVQLGGDQFKLR